MQPGQLVKRKIAKYKKMLDEEGVLVQALQTKTFKRIVQQHGVKLSATALRKLQRIVEMHTVSIVADAIYLQKAFKHKTLTPTHIKAAVRFSNKRS